MTYTSRGKEWRKIIYKHKKLTGVFNRKLGDVLFTS